MAFAGFGFSFARFHLFATLGRIVLVIAVSHAPAPAVARAQEGGSVVISQIYGGGGNSGASYTHDFIELFNPGSVPATLSGWSVQYAKSDGANWSVTLLDGAIAPGGYFLVQQAQGNGGDTPLPAPDVVGSQTMAADKGKVALVAGQAGITGKDDPAVVDFVGYGSATEFEGADHAPTLSNTTAAVRREGGCQDTDDNAADFEKAGPVPRNSSVIGTPCGDAPPPVATSTPTFTPEPPTVTATATPIAADTATLTPTATFTPTLTPSFTPTITPTIRVTPTLTPTVAVTLTPTPTATISPTQVATATPLPTLTPTVAPPLFTPGMLLISEFMANPDAVPDSDGEWLELVNMGTETIALAGWSLRDEGTNEFPVAVTSTLTIAPGQYLVLVRSPDPLLNGGIAATEDQRYAGFDLANGDDEIILLAPDGTEIDRVVWGDGAVPVVAGASSERTALTADAPWVTAAAPWAGSTGDFGSPGAAYVVPTRTPTPTATPTVTPAVPVDTPTFTTTPTPVTPATPLPDVRLSEFLANPDAVGDDQGEWIELYNAHDQPVNLYGWSLADMGGDLHVFAADLIVDAGGLLVLVRNDDPSLNGGVTGDYRYTGISLANGDDELILRGPDGTVVDRVVWGVDGGAPVTAGASTQRRPDGTWEIATVPWAVGSDAGSPGLPYTAPPSTPVPTSTPTPSPGPTPTAAWQPTPGPAPAVKLSELMINPAAVDDGDGEWIELYNPTAATVNLRGWALADRGSERHSVAQDLLLSPRSYVVLGRNADRATNGGVTVDYLYTGISLANGDDELLLIAPDDSVVDELAWGDGTALDAPGGASLVRVDLTGDNWTPSLQSWAGSAGDRGSPGTVYVPVTPTLTAPPILVPTATPATPATPDAPTVPPWTGPLPALLITEFLADPAAVSDSDGEWLELHNADDRAVNLQGWILADLDGERHVIADPVTLAPGGYVVVARHGARNENGGVAVDYVYSGISLGNDGDEIVLLAPGEREVDRVVWGDGGSVPVARGRSTQRRPSGAWALSTTPWAGSDGDWGTPGSAFYAPEVESPDDEPDRNPPPIDVPTPIPTDPWTGPVPPVYISEVLANPAAVDDSDGEWLELHNASDAAVNLRGWILADLGTDEHVIAADVRVPPGGYAVLGRNADRAANGGVTVAYVYSGFSLANGDDEVLLLAPNREEADRVVWGDELSVSAGASLERTGFAPPRWQRASTSWPGSAGDLGSPGATSGPAAPDGESPDPAPDPGGPTIPTDPWTGPVPPVYISEVLANPAAVDDSDGEWLELHNASDAAVNLRGWILADLGTDEHVIAADVRVPPGGYAVLGRNADRAANGGVTVAYVYSGFSLANGDDEVLLLAPNREEADRVVWGDELEVSAGASLERTGFAPPRWQRASTSWPGSAGDLGSPGATSGPAAPDGESPDPAPDPDPGPDEPSTPTPPPLPNDGPTTLLLSEFLANPAAVGDSDGEWIELVNWGDAPVNLRGWSLADLGTDRFTVAVDLIVAPGGYVVLARELDPIINGGVGAALALSGISLANGDDELLLFAPNGDEIDRVVWGDDLTVRAGVALERAAPMPEAPWQEAQAPWQLGGDLGSPGIAPGVIVPPTEAPPTGDKPAAATWAWTATAAPVVIDEVAFRGSDQEFIVLRNVTEAPVDLSGWLVGDAAVPGGGEGLYALPAGLTVAPAGSVILARNGAGFVAHYVLRPDAEFEDSADAIPTLTRRRDLATGQFALKDSGDEVVLLTPDGQLVDAVAYGTGDAAALGLAGALLPPTGDSLQRVDGAPPQADQRHRFLFAPPDPFRSVTLPTAVAPPHPQVGDDLIAAWGTLGATSNFGPDGSAPPHFVLAHAAAAGLDFVALADAAPTEPWLTPSQVLHLPAWRWEDDTDAAVIYAPQLRDFSDAATLLGYAAAMGVPVQWQGADAPPAAGGTAVDGGNVDVPADLSRLAQAWAAAGAPLLPAGNSMPPLPGHVDAAPRYTGLAVPALTADALGATLLARRGWLTNSPGLWLTLRAVDATGAHWMGDTIAPTNEVTLEVGYGDATSEFAGLAIWQDGQPLRQLDLPSTDGRWQVTVPAVPGTFLFAVATQADGGFAVTAPVHVRPEQGGTVRISRVVPVPGADYNGDGQLTADDEFIELLNPGDTPVSLTGWQLSDSRGDETPSRRFVFGPGRALAGGARVQLFRSETRINLNNAADWVRLLDPDGNEVDVLRWEEAPAPGVVFEQDPTDGQWRTGVIDLAPPPWAGPAVVQTGTRVEPEDPWEQWAEGQAPGALGSVAMAKRRGLYVWTEFEGVVVAPPGLFNTAIYVADVAEDGTTAGIGIQVYLRYGAYPELAPGDRVRVRGETRSFRGEMEMFLESPEQIWRVAPGAVPAPLAVTVADIGEPLEGRLVTFEGVVTGWQGTSIFLGDPADPDAAPVRVTVRNSLDWRRPYVNEGERFRVIGIVGQFASEAPWNDGYRVLPRYVDDLLAMDGAGAD